jgi:hypothetical protein
MGHPNLARCEMYNPPPHHHHSKNPMYSLVQPTRPVLCLPICHVMRPITGPHAYAYVRTITQANVQERSLLVHDRTSNVGAICHAMSHLRPTRDMRPMPARWPVRATARVGSDTICNTLPTKATPPNPFEERAPVHIAPFYNVCPRFM